MITAVEQTPQLIYQHNHLIAAVIRADLFQEFLAWQVQQRPLAQVFTELRQLCVDEGYINRIEGASPGVWILHLSH